MSPKYSKPPIVVAMCEVHFDPASPWDLAVPGLLYEELRELFPTRSQTPAFEAVLAATPEGVTQQVRRHERLQFSQVDERIIVQVGNHYLAVHHRPPYSTWEEFLPRIRTVLERYRKIASPTRVQRISLTYANSIVLPGDNPEPDEFFDFYPHIGPRLPKQMVGLNLAVQFPFDDLRDLLQVAMATASSARSEEATIALNLQYFLAKPFGVELEAIVPWLEVGHQRIEEAFEGSITDNLRRRLEPRGTTR